MDPRDVARLSVQWPGELARAARPPAKSYCQAKVRPCEKAGGSDAVESCRQIASPGDKAGIDEREGEEERRVSAVSILSFRLKADDPTCYACQSEDVSQHRTVYKIRGAPHLKGDSLFFRLISIVST